MTQVLHPELTTSMGVLVKPVIWGGELTSTISATTASGADFQMSDVFLKMNMDGTIYLQSSIGIHPSSYIRGDVVTRQSSIPASYLIYDDGEILTLYKFYTKFPPDSIIEIAKHNVLSYADIRLLMDLTDE